ncbi:MAG: gliding motility protein GldC [Flavobacteriales bacterium]|nr:gliding motility protein GldC [Flavobacteriales bacterium]
MSKKSEINFKIHLDENHIPEKIEWSASDSGEEGTKEAKSFMMSLWDAHENNTLRIDLWTKDMMVDEMKYFFYQSLITMGDTYERATSDKAVANEIREFGKQLGEKLVNSAQ